MGRTYDKRLGMLIMVAMLCLTGLVMSGEAQAQRFVDNGDGTVTDTATNLMWAKDANPFGNYLNWDDAMARCSSFSISGTRLSGQIFTVYHPGIHHLIEIFEGKLL